MKTFLTATLLLVSILSFAQTDPRITVVKNYLDAAFNRDTETQKNLMDENIIDYHPTVLAPPAKGSEELIMGWNNTMQPLDSVKYERTGTGIVSLSDGDFEGEWVLETGMVHMKMTGVDSWIEVQMVGLYKVNQDKITEIRNFGNMLDLYQQMGYSMTPPGK